MKRFLLVFLFAGCASSPPMTRQPSGACPSIQGKVGILFGGDLATTAALRPCYPDLLSVSKYDAPPLLDCLAQQIDALAGRQKFVVAGHSSGAAFAERLAQRVRDKSKIRLVLLEGYGDPANQRGVETSCWYAKNGALEGFNAPSMLDRKVCPGGASAYEAPWCRSVVCLHVSLVNLRSPEDLSRKTIGSALDSCEGNRAWLNRSGDSGN